AGRGERRPGDLLRPARRLRPPAAPVFRPMLAQGLAARRRDAPDGELRPRRAAPARQAARRTAALRPRGGTDRSRRGYGGENPAPGRVDGPAERPRSARPAPVLPGRRSPEEHRRPFRSVAEHHLADGDARAAAAVPQDVRALTSALKDSRSAT